MALYMLLRMSAERSCLGGRGGATRDHDSTAKPRQPDFHMSRVAGIEGLSCIFACQVQEHQGPSWMLSTPLSDIICSAINSYPHVIC